MVPHLGWKHGVFGNPYKAALHGRHINILNVLFEDGPYVGAREKYRLAQNAAENGDDEMVEFILQADWAPRKIFRDGYRPVNEFERALRTRSIKLFNMAMQEKEIVDQSPLMPEVLNRLLRNAINRGWVDMVRHIISLVGVPPESLAKIKFETEQALYCACKAGHDAVVKLLLDRQVHVSGAELEAAASLGHTSTVNLLLEHGADVHSARAQDCLATAAVKGYLGIVRMLLDAGMNPNKGFIVPMIQAVRAEHPGICQLLSERGATMTVAQAIAEVTKRDEFAGQAVAWPDPRARHLPLQLENADRMLQVHRG
jgi:hypothetical protein